MLANWHASHRWTTFPDSIHCRSTASLRWTGTSSSSTARRSAERTRTFVGQSPSLCRGTRRLRAWIAVLSFRSTAATRRALCGCGLAGPLVWTDGAARRCGLDGPVQCFAARQSRTKRCSTLYSSAPSHWCSFAPVHFTTKPQRTPWTTFVPRCALRGTAGPLCVAGMRRHWRLRRCGPRALAPRSLWKDGRRAEALPIRGGVWRLPAHARG
jgi:hypothetical protein